LAALAEKRFERLATSVDFHHATPGLGRDVEIYQSAEWGFRSRDKAVRGMHFFDASVKNRVTMSETAG